MKAVKGIKINYIISAALYICLGVLLLIWPGISVKVICWSVAAVTLVSGVVRIIGYFTRDVYNLAFQFDLALGIFSIMLAALLFIRPNWIINLLPAVLGLFVTVNGLFTLQTSVDAKRFGLKYWWMLLMLALFSIGFGALVTLNPFKSALVFVRIFGLTLIFTGIEKLTVAIYTIRTKKQIKDDSSPFIEVDYVEVR